MKVLQVIDNFSKTSGIANAILNYYYLMDKNIVQFDFLVVTYDSSIKEKVESMGAQVFTMSKLGLTNLALFKNEIEAFFCKHGNEYAAVHSNFYQIDFILFSVAKRYGIKTCISHCHNTRYADYFLRSLRNFVLSRLGRMCATDYVACSENAGKFMFGKRKKVYILNNAIECCKYAYNETIRNELRTKLDLDDKFVVGHVGRFNKQKNHKFLFEVFKKYKAQHENAVLLLVGGGELMPQIKAYASRLGIENDVIYMGVQNDVASILQAMDCFVFPSYYEGLGIALIEAQASGLPCVASSVIPKETKVTDLITYLPLGDSAKWADCINDKMPIERTDTSSDIIRNGYDLRTNICALTDYYAGLLTK